MANTLDKTGRLDNETIRVVRAVLWETYPPINPNVLLRAALNWYGAHGGGEVMRAFMDWLIQVFSFDVNAADGYKPYRLGQDEFADKTGISKEEAKVMSI